MRFLLLTLTMGWFTLASDVAAEGIGDRLSLKAAVVSRYDENIALAPTNRSERYDFRTRVSLSGVIQVVNSLNQELSLSLTPFYEGAADLGDLSRYGVGAGVNYRTQFGPEFTAPFVRAAIRADWQEFENSEPRDGFAGDGEVVLGKQFNPKVGAEVGFRYRFQRSTNDSPEGSAVPDALGGLSVRGAADVFDTNSVGGFIRFAVDPAPRWSGFVEYNYMTGDVSSTADLLDVESAEEFETVRDFALEEGLQFQAYRIDADQHIFTVGAALAASDKLTVDVTARYLDANGEFNNDYTNLVFIVGGSWRF